LLKNSDTKKQSDKNGSQEYPPFSWLGHFVSPHLPAWIDKRKTRWLWNRPPAQPMLAVRLRSGTANRTHHNSTSPFCATKSQQFKH
jgi:hypothetical protein